VKTLLTRSWPQYIETGKKEATLVTGGNKMGDKGYFIEVSSHYRTLSFERC
jgi:hypothetical protein